MLIEIVIYHHPKGFYLHSLQFPWLFPMWFFQCVQTPQTTKGIKFCRQSQNCCEYKIELSIMVLGDARTRTTSVNILNDITPYLYTDPSRFEWNSIFIWMSHSSEIICYRFLPWHFTKKIIPQTSYFSRVYCYWVKRLPNTE